MSSTNSALQIGNPRSPDQIVISIWDIKIRNLMELQLSIRQEWGCVTLRIGIQVTNAQRNLKTLAMDIVHQSNYSAQKVQV